MDVNTLEAYVELAKNDREFFRNLSQNPGSVVAGLSSAHNLMAAEAGENRADELSHSKCPRTSCGTSSFLI